MQTKSTMLHLRVPFSYFLMPTYLFALNCAEKPILWKIVLVFFILHFLLYPASNSYNSYYDRDTESIGILKNPPPVEKELLIISLLLDVLAVFFSLLIGWLFAAAVFFYGLVSKAYSHNKIRVKKMPVLSLIGVGFFQGAFIFLISLLGIQDISVTEILNMQIIFAAVISSLSLTAAYPMTQIYQHKADRERGEISFSMLLGIKGTFLFCAVFILLAIACFVFYFLSYYSLLIAAVFILFLAPVAAFFVYWTVITFRDESKADYDNTLRLNLISSTALNTFMILLMAVNHFKLN